MQPLFDLLPILLFFITFKLAGVYVGTAVMMGACLVQNGIYWLMHRRFEKMQLLILISVLLLGGLTLLFHNPLFIKWKPTIIYWLFAAGFIGSHFVGKKYLIQHMMESNVSFAKNNWRQLNIIFTALFFLMGALNLYVAYSYTTNTWVNFKLFGALAFTVVLAILLTVYMARFGKLNEGNAKSNSPSTAANEKK